MSRVPEKYVSENEAIWDVLHLQSIKWKAQARDHPFDAGIFGETPV